MEQVKYFNSRSRRLWFWRLKYRTSVRNKLLAQRAKEREKKNYGPMPNWGTAKIPADLAATFFTKALEYEHRAETSSDVRVMNDMLRMAEYYLEEARKATAFVR